MPTAHQNQWFVCKLGPTRRYWKLFWWKKSTPCLIFLLKNLSKVDDSGLTFCREKLEPTGWFQPHQPNSIGDFYPASIKQTIKSIAAMRLFFPYRVSPTNQRIKFAEDIFPYFFLEDRNPFCCQGDSIWSDCGMTQGQGVGTVGRTRCDLPFFLNSNSNKLISLRDLPIITVKCFSVFLPSVFHCVNGFPHIF